MHFHHHRVEEDVIPPVSLQGPSIAVLRPVRDTALVDNVLTTPRCH
jgi:hypothetical protein